MAEETHVLVVDDEEVIRDGCRRVLTGRGYEIATAENGRQALEMLAAQEIDILLLDLKNARHGW